MRLVYERDGYRQEYELPPERAEAILQGQEWLARHWRGPGRIEPSWTALPPNDLVDALGRDAE